MKVFSMWIISLFILVSSAEKTWALTDEQREHVHGTADSGGSVVTHTFTSPGEFKVRVDAQEPSGKIASKTLSLTVE